MKYEFIEKRRSCFEVGKMCLALKVSRSGYYRWRKEPMSRRDRENKELLKDIVKIHKSSRFTYGSPRIHAELRDMGYFIGRNRVAKLMRMNKIRAKTKKRFKITTHSKHKHSLYPNLLKDIEIVKPDQAWVSDITYIRTYEGWLYLCVIMDLYSRSIVGWSMEDRLTKELVLKSLEMAYMRRNPGKGLIFHSDRGSQYASDEFRRSLSRKGFIASMSGKGNCYDNAYAESLFHTIKVEEAYDSSYRTREVAKSMLFEYIEVFYNKVRRHSGLGYLSPYQFEQMLKLQKVA
jgi:transposase InsO family protein